jgi:ABC-type lipoprotein release transport system permease subunit
MKNQRNTPPKLLLRFFRWYCHPDYLEDIEGDLLERFENKSEEKGYRRAKWNFIKDVFLLFRPGIIRSLLGGYQLNTIDMFRHNFLLTFRNFNRYRSSFLINLTGLSTGLACSLLIYLWVSDELSFDKFHEHDKQLYQVMLNHEESGSLNTNAITQTRLAKALAEEVPEVVLAVEDTPSEWFADNFTLSDGKTNFHSLGKFAGEAYFQMFSFDLLIGKRSQVLSDKKSIVISESLARKLFKNPNDAIGKFIDWSLMHFKGSATVSGVFRDLPSNSTDQFEFIIPFKNFEELFGKQSDTWGNYNAITHVLLKEDTDIPTLNAKIGNFVKEKVKRSNVILFVRPFSDRYLYNNYENGVLAGGRIDYVKLLSIVAIFILSIACINFMNLSTARASRRVKEVGVKKAIGASRKALIFQYLSESTLLVFIALVVSIGLVLVLLPQFNSITGKNLSIPLNPAWILTLMLVSIITGIFSGSYPALYMSGFNPISVLKGKLSTSFGEMWARRGLVVFQFTLSILLIVSVVVVYYQIDYLQTKNLGFDKDNIIIFSKEGAALEQPDIFIEKLKGIPGVVNCGLSAHSFTESGSFTTGIKWEGKDPDVAVRFANATVYYDLIETLGIQIKSGRSFSRAFSAEGSNVLFNEKAIEVMGLNDEDPIGMTVKVWGEQKTIIGVVKDFHFQSLHEEVQPMFFRFDTSFLPLFMVKIAAGKERETLTQIKDFYHEFNPEYTLDYKFMDQKYHAQYVAEQRIAVLSRYFAGVAIIISCLGLFGLAAFTAERRLKEVGIRKILGSGNGTIVYLLSEDFTKMIMVAIAISIPLSYFITKNWLDGFAYHIDLKWWFFAGAGFAALLIAWFTVGMQTVKAAGVNPVDCLRDE